MSITGDYVPFTVTERPVDIPRRNAWHEDKIHNQHYAHDQNKTL